MQNKGHIWNVVLQSCSVHLLSRHQWFLHVVSGVWGNVYKVSYRNVLVYSVYRKRPTALVFLWGGKNPSVDFVLLWHRSFCLSINSYILLCLCFLLPHSSIIHAVLDFCGMQFVLNQSGDWGLRTLMHLLMDCMKLKLLPVLWLS